MSDETETSGAIDAGAMTGAQLEMALGASLGSPGMALLRAALADARAFVPLDVECAGLERNDVGNAQRLIRRYPDRIMYVEGVGWHGWVGKGRAGHWSARHGKVTAKRAAQDVHKDIFSEAKALLQAGPYPRENAEEFEKRIRAHYSWAVMSGNGHRLREMVDQTTPDVTRHPDELDAAPLLFNVANGTLDLTDPDKIKLRAARPDDLITRQSPAKYDPKATCPKFLEFISEILPDVEVRKFVQRLLGYCLTGETSEQALALWWGDGANGKGVLAALLLYVLDEYGKAVQFASLMSGSRRGGAEASPDIARLRGARAAIASEPENQVPFSEGLVKQLTGEDKVTARHLREEFFEYVPMFKIIGLFNNKPPVRGTDGGIWRRLMLVPFTVIIPKARRDKKLAKKLQAEASGILNWMIAGYVEWRAIGLAAPQAVTDATAEYRAESDKIGAFLEVACVKGDDADEVEAGLLFTVYTQWCKANGESVQHQTSFGKRVGKTYHRARSSVTGRTVYVGVNIADAWVPKSTMRPDAVGHYEGHGDDPGYEPEGIT